MFRCPICLNEYCNCGFKDGYHLFDIFKYTKNVFLNRIEYSKSDIDVVYDDYIDIVSNERGLEYIEGPYIASKGILAFRVNTKALILNCHYADGDFLDESRVEILFIGKDFIDFIGEPRMLEQIRYLYVDKDNPYYYADNNKLYKR